MAPEIDDCPCSGKNMSNLAAPWILLTLYSHQGTHGYEISKIISTYMGDFQVGMNITGLYRHLNLLEQRGMLRSEWDTPEKGPPKRRYFLTAAGETCLWRWMNTLCSQVSLIGRFLDQARAVFPKATLPTVQLEGDLTP